jgi:hypothetical protein
MARKFFIQVIVALLTSVSVGVPALASGESTAFRKDFNSLTEQEINEYRKVVSSMKALPETDPRSWRWFSGIHHYYTEDDVKNMQGVSKKDKKEMMPYILVPNEVVKAKNAWNQCHQYHPDKLFLLWHRVYLHYFEKVARKVSGQPNWSLPYWNYTAGTKKAREIPQAFRTRLTKDSSINPLHAPRRASINRGHALDEDIVSLSALDNSSYEDFQSALEHVPHNVVHDALGKENSLLMGAISWAAQDPIFWLHHANLDRVWDCWTNRGGVLPTFENDGRTYQFTDEDGSIISLTIPQMQNLVQNVIKVKYQSYEDCQRSPFELKPLTAESVDKNKNTISVQTSKPVTLTSKQVSVSFLGPKGLRNTGGIIQIENAIVSGYTSVSYIVSYRAIGDKGNGISIGFLNFFGKEGNTPDSGHEGHHHHGNAKPVSLEIPLSRFAENSFELVFTPTTGVENDKVVGDVPPVSIQKITVKYYK